MAVSFTIPTYYTAVDKFSGPVKAMERASASFGARLETVSAKSERWFRKLTPGLSDATKQMIGFASSAALVGAAIGSIKSIMDYESEIANLSAITGTSGAALDIFKNNIRDVSLATKESSINVAKAFTQIGNNAPELLKDASALAEVTKQSIILAQASKMELAPAADALTTIMNQFNKPAKEAKSVIDLLAGGMVIGSTDIDKVADAMTRFGGVASQVAGVSLEESVTAIEAISDKMKDAEKIGSQFKNIFLRMSSISVQDPKAIKDLKAAGVNIGIVESKTEPLINKLKELKKLQGIKGGLEHVFGTENLQSLIPLLNSTDKYSEMIKKLTTSEEAHNAAQKMADKNNDTLLKKLDHLKNKFVTMITTSNGASKGLNIFKKVIGFVADHLDGIVTIGVAVVGFFLAWKTIIIATRAAMIAYNVVLGINSALMGESAFVTYGNTVAYGAYRTAVLASEAATWLATTAQTALNFAMLANPIGLVIVAVAALTAAIIYLIYQKQMLTEEYKKGIEDKTSKALEREKQSVNMLAARYEKLGMSKSEAFNAATKYEQKEINRQRQETENKIKTMPYDEKRLALEAQAKDLAVQNQSLAQIRLDANQKQLINPMQAKSEATANNIALEVNVNNDGGQSSVTAKDKSKGGSNSFSLKPSLGSTYQ